MKCGWSATRRLELLELWAIARQIADGCVVFLCSFCSTPKSCHVAVPPRKVNSEHGSKVVFHGPNWLAPSSETAPQLQRLFGFFFKAVRSAAFQTALAPRLTLWRCPPFFAGLEERVSNQNNQWNRCFKRTFSAEVSVGVLKIYSMEPKWPLSWLEFGPSFEGLFRPKIVDKQVLGIHIFTKVTRGHLGYLGSKANRLNSFAKETQQIHTHIMNQWASLCEVCPALLSISVRLLSSCRV